MDDFVFLTDIINILSQLSPWIQSLLIVTLACLIIAIVYFMHKFIKLFIKKKKEHGWRDKYYRDGR